VPGRYVLLAPLGINIMQFEWTYPGVSTLITNQVKFVKSEKFNGGLL